MNENGKTKNEKLSGNKKKKQIIRKVLANSQVNALNLHVRAFGHIPSLRK